MFSLHHTWLNKELSGFFYWRYAEFGSFLKIYSVVKLRSLVQRLSYPDTDQHRQKTRVLQRWYVFFHSSCDNIVLSMCRK